MKPICFGCSHFLPYSGAPLKCTAFIEGIPEAILSGEADHRKPYPGDNGIRFKSI